jgi:hypothetical protein
VVANRRVSIKINGMKKLFPALVALALTAPAAAAAQDVAPAVKRKPPATVPAAPQREQHYQAALTAAASQDDAALDASLIRGMSRLLAAGKCAEAAGLANRDGRKELASRAQQLCK